MVHAKNAPVLRLVPTAAVRFHEHPEPRRTARLVERIRDERMLRNPPVVTEYDTGRYVLLDGANRVSAFRQIGYALVPVQVVDYDDAAIELKGWHHLLLEGAGLELRAAYRRISGVRVEAVSRQQMAALLDRRLAFAVLVDDKGGCWALLPEAGTGFGLRRWIAVLEQVVDAYEGKTRLERIKWADWSELPPLYKTLEHQLCLFPRLAKPELLQIVRDGLLIPTGITRHVVPGRALGLDLDLDFLARASTDDERQAHFEAHVHGLEMQGRIRYYEESVFLLDE